MRYTIGAGLNAGKRFFLALRNNSHNEFKTGMDQSFMNVYLVGGAVRDKLLNLPVKDRDWVVVGATPDELLQQGYQAVGKGFPVFLHPQTHEEYALALRTGSRFHDPGSLGVLLELLHDGLEFLVLFQI